MASEQRLDERFNCDVGWVVLVHVDLFDHDEAFGIDLGGTERRPLEHLCQNIQAGVEIGIEQSRPEARVFLGCEGVALCTDLVKRLGDVSR